MVPFAVFSITAVLASGVIVSHNRHKQRKFIERRDHIRAARQSHWERHLENVPESVREERLRLE